MGAATGKSETGRTFTDSFLRGLKPGAKPYKRAEWAPKGEGRLVVRVLPSGVKEFFYRYRADEQDKTLSLGRFDASGRNGRTLAGVRAELHKKRALQRSTGDVKEHEATEARRKDAERRKGTLEQLLDAYADALEAAGKPSASKARGIFRRHVTRPFPSLAATKASDVKPGDIQRILARMVKAGITREVNKARAYLGAAFTYGGKADHDPRTIAKEGVLFGLVANPVSMVPTIPEFERTSDRILSDAELRAYWLGLEALPPIQRAILRLNVALACQRVTQLLRADWAAFDFKEKTLLLKDTKGRGGSRDHLLPLTDFALEQLAPLREINAMAPMPFTTDGKRAIVLDTLTKGVAEVVDRLETEQKMARFGLRDIRRTAETHLQRLGIDKEVRAHLLSHGRTSGVQGKHYERYDFLDEKRRALRKWAAHLERIISGTADNKVTGLRAA